MTVSSNQPVPDPRKADCFRFLACSYDPESGIARLSYSFDDGPELVEKIVFPHAPWPPEASRQAVFKRALELLHLVAGVSYYKAGLCRKIEVQNTRSLAGLESFLTELYVHGLGELGYVNEVNIAERVHFPRSSLPADEMGDAARPLILPKRALVAMGGGKDSLVGLDRVQGAGLEVMPICVGSSNLIKSTVKSAALPLLQVGRQLAPELAAMNRAGAWNGHVPVTAINSAILLCAAVLYGFRYVVFSNERSADEATLVTPQGIEVNHQYSKSSAFESAFRAVIAAQVSPDIEYFSILRPFSELGVVQRFSAMKKFHPVFSSCNRNFHLEGPRVQGRWCLNCPKCRFAALSLAVFLPPEEVIAIQGGDLLNDPDQEQGFRALCGLGRDKPFECVGEAGESRAALAALGGRERWSRHVIVQALAPELRRVDVPPLEPLLQPAGEHFIPACFTDADSPTAMLAAPVAILGAGREGQAAWRFLRESNPQDSITLIAETEPEADFIGQLSARDHVLTGPLAEAGLHRFKTLIRSPGISPYRSSLQRAIKAGARITTPSNLWFAAHPRERTICITGTKGKSTTSSLLAFLLESLGQHVRLAGNIGLPLLDCDDRKVDWWVIELSSYQLADLDASPTVSVILNLTAEHLDWHGGEETYRNDKLRLARLSGQRPLLLNAADTVLTEALSGRDNVEWFNHASAIHVQDGRLFDADTELPVSLPQSLPGVHNLTNVAAALSVLRLLGEDVAKAARFVSAFKGLPHRLQLLGETEGVRYVNDSIASTPFATVAALESCAGQEVTLLVGGLDRGVDWSPYMNRIRKVPPRAIIALPDSGPKIIRALQQAGISPGKGWHEADDLAAAVGLAGKLTGPGGVVLLSPGAPSFPRFTDYRDRGRQFAELSGFELTEQAFAGRKKSKAAGQG
ncbi:MAG: UDP-N-acetylmuramoyl-L-alanine--D-glutamate ligase [Xanthomonadales bacterium]|nr:UDP-N-acetylmuramoyl-L-alanine--D-glutamate ligase [Xanthomonadales bacterium]